MASSSKKAKGPSPDSFGTRLLSEKINEDRRKCSNSISEFNFNEKRVRVLSDTKDVPETCKGILYWMSRDQRVNDNWAMLYAQKEALKKKVPLHVCFCLVPKFLGATIRHYDFLLKGLEEVSKECMDLNINFHLLLGSAVNMLTSFVIEHNIGAVVVDFSPLRDPKKWVDDVKNALPSNIPFYQVDAHNIVPCWETSKKLEYGARTIRNKINTKLPEFLTPFPPVTYHPHPAIKNFKNIDWKAADKLLEVDRTITPVSWAKPGTMEGLKVLEAFANKGIKNFGSKRNDPNANALSNLSPWFHFGQISVQRCILVVKVNKSNSESVAIFCEEAIIRRELSDNFCWYNDKYDSIEGSTDWAKKSLNEHRKDKREYVYTKAELENSLTHDDLWNSAQIQLVKEGKMHGFLRMYWAKKILEWTSSPEEALATAIYFNDRYSLDGRDPSGYVGCMWSICGVHDRAWASRDVFGKIRFMNYQGCRRKFDVAAYVAHHGGQIHTERSGHPPEPLPS